MAKSYTPQTTGFRLIALDAPRFALVAAVARFAVADFGGAVIASGLH